MPTSRETNPILGPAVEPATLWAKGEYRRSCLYVVIGFILVAALSVLLPPARSWGATLGLAVFITAAFWLWLYVQTWRLRIDSTGLARRRLGAWSYWSWQDFSAGRVQAGDNPLSFRCAARPWWDRWLLLEFAEPDTVATEIARLLGTLIPTPPDEADPTRGAAVPTEVAIGLGLSQRLQLTSQGIEVRRGRESRRFSWDDVRILRLTRERVQHGFLHRLELQLRGGEPISGRVNSVRIDGRWIWAIGNRHADWPQRLASLTPPRCWQVFQNFGDLQSRAEGEYRLAHWRQKGTSARRMRAVLPPVFLALSGWAFIPKLIVAGNVQFFPPWWKAVALVCLALTIVVPPFAIWAVLHYLARAFARLARETEEELARLLPPNDHGTCN
jgi:hypothetical protein